MARRQASAGSAARGGAATGSPRPARRAGAATRRRSSRRPRACARTGSRGAGTTRPGPSVGRWWQPSFPLSRSSHSPRALDYDSVYADEILRPWHEALMEALPGTKLFDVHTHTGFNDPDGLHCSAKELIDGLELVNARAVVF